MQLEIDLHMVWIRTSFSLGLFVLWIKCNNFVFGKMKDCGDVKAVIR